MRPNRTNSFRLHRISRATSLKKQSQTFYQPDQTFKLAAINSVTRGVKHADLSYVTGDDLNKLRKQPLDNEDGHYESSHANMVEVRAKYDDMKKQRKQKDETIYRLKEQIRKYQIFENQYQSKIDKATSQAQRMMDELREKKMELEQVTMQKRVLMNMRKRLKQDKVVYDQRKFNLEKEERFLNKQKSVFHDDHLEIGQGADRTNKVYQKLSRELAAEQEERMKHINNLQMMINKKAMVNEQNERRQSELVEIAERAMQDKDPNEKNWYRIYLTHSFVSKMLRNKIDREMQKFAVVQIAFKTIKTATGINDAQHFVYKYLNKEAEYGDLLGRITANEKKISELQEETERLIREQKQLEVQRETIQNMKIVTVDVSNEFKELDKIEEKKKLTETNESKIYQWLNKQFKKFQCIEKVDNLPTISKDKTEMVEAFKQFLYILSQSLKKCEKQDINEEVTEIGDLTSRDSARVTRVMPKKSRKNSIGEQIFDLGEQDVPQTVDMQQSEMISNQREQVVRNNQKFMKEAKKRYEEKRKALMEANATKKQKKAPEVKKEEDQN